MKNKTTAWTAEEDAALAAALEDKISAARLTVRLQRSEAAIKRRMRDLGLSARRRNAADPEQRIEPTLFATRLLQSCKAGDLVGLMLLYHTEATLECACTGDAIFAGSSAIQEYWAPKIGSRHPRAFSLLSAGAEDMGIRLDYLGYEGKPIRMHLSLDLKGKITRSACGPRSCNPPA